MILLLLRQFQLALPLFVLILLGFSLIRFAGWTKQVSFAPSSSESEGASREEPAATRAVEVDEAEAEEEAEEGPAPPLPLPPFTPDGGGGALAWGGVSPFPAAVEDPPNARPPIWAERDAGESGKSWDMSGEGAGTLALR